MFHGPREEVVPFFEGLGFALPPRKGVADFLQEITSRKEQKVHMKLLLHTACILQTNTPMAVQGHSSGRRPAACIMSICNAVQMLPALWAALTCCRRKWSDA